MPTFSERSMGRLNTCAPDIVTIMTEAIRYMDFAIVFGFRSPQEQFELFKKGRVQETDGTWVVKDKSKIVTYKDGFEKKSYHNKEPKSHAIDVIPWPTGYKDPDKFHELAGVIKVCQAKLLEADLISRTLKWGFDLWGWDEPHWQI